MAGCWRDRPLRPAERGFMPTSRWIAPRHRCALASAERIGAQGRQCPFPAPL